MPTAKSKKYPSITAGRKAAAAGAKKPKTKGMGKGKR